MDFFHTTDLSQFFTSDDVLEVVTDLKDTPFIGYFVNHNYEYICLCDADGNKSVVPSCNIKYITSHKSAPMPYASPLPEAKTPETESFDTMPQNHITPEENAPAGIEDTAEEDDADNGEPRHIMASGISETLLSATDDGVEGTLRVPTLRVTGKIDVDEINERNARKKKGQQHTRYVDPLEKLYPEAKGTVKRTGPKFGFITPEGEDQDRCYQTHNVVGRIYPGDKVVYIAYDYIKGPQARTVMKVCSVAEMIDRMEEMRYERYGKSQIADMVAILKEAFPDNDLVAEALRDTGFDRYKIRERHLPRTENPVVSATAPETSESPEDDEAPASDTATEETVLNPDKEDTPAAESPATETPTEETSAEEAPSADAPAEEAPAEESAATPEEPKGDAPQGEIAEESDPEPVVS